MDTPVKMKIYTPITLFKKTLVKKMSPSGLGKYDSAELKQNKKIKGTLALEKALKSNHYLTLSL